jgi:hypothetical protein
VADLKTSADVLVDRVIKYGVNRESIDGIVCNFAIHYMCDTAENIKNFISFVAKLLKPGGMFIFTTMDGKKVHEQLRDVKSGSMWTLVEDDMTKYAIRKEFSGDLAKYGQKISVKLPFSNEMYEEPLCNIDYVISVCEKHGFSMEIYSSMDTYLDKFKKADRGLYDKLTHNDITYNSFHAFVTLKKIK